MDLDLPLFEFVGLAEKQPRGRLFKVTLSLSVSSSSRRCILPCIVSYIVPEPTENVDVWKVKLRGIISKISGPLENVEFPDS